MKDLDGRAEIYKWVDVALEKNGVYKSTTGNYMNGERTKIVLLTNATNFKKHFIQFFQMPLHINLF